MNKKEVVTTYHNEMVTDAFIIIIIIIIIFIIITIVIISYTGFAPGVLNRTAKFLNRWLTEQELKQVCGHVSFESMKKNPSVNYEEVIVKIRKGQPLQKREHFIRKGQLDGWKEDLSQEACKKIDDWTREMLRGIDYPASV